MKIVLAVLLLALIPPVNCNKEEEIVKPKMFFHEDSKNYPYNEDDKIIDFEKEVIHYESNIIKIK